MIVIRELSQFPALSQAVVTSGTFDGVHVGHQKILSRLIEAARQDQGQSVVITYWPHPRTVLRPEDDSLRLLSTVEERIEALRAFGVDYLLLLPFTKEFAQLSSEEYIQQILIKTIRTKKLVIGYDHRFGKNREGGFDYLQQNASRYGFVVEEIPRQDVDAIGVSSSKIRTALEKGDVATAAKYLGRPYALTGTVVTGKQLGRTIGFPTANLELPEKLKLVPAQGVYAVQVQTSSGTYKGMLNIGTRPTVNGTSQTIEVHLFDFNGDLYGQDLTLSFASYLRPEQKFSGLDALIAQLRLDRTAALQVLG
ncbi:bifunctional riboflavin kinase/FAD synthetase [Rufibacter glacialis]|uniref:Riboflavin biosynthesis protein n=1 Tax=Rufibacter glacialis TaxID=1259555 RepID=A0A5M8QIE0_9BACT|nr:bifunctional riboflavin kinase/FAD synthetase [Rufibacter glacialis]KAA6434583.1 bifunctional riboflavin kinase/FAD synthetase [Rufibacter glacialis]GGK70779.1 riboflavin biosynthesis protein [Rufibacter glacialis]